MAIPERLNQLAAEVGFEVTVNRYRAGTYPFPGYEQLVALYVTPNEKYQGFTWAKGTNAGGTLFWVVVEQMKRRPAIAVRFNAPVRDLLTHDGTVIGAVVESEGQWLEAWPIITNTQGGPVHNARQQVLDAFGQPIPRLYKAGEMGSVFGHVYALGGNNSECFIGGPIAGCNAAAEPAWC